MRNEAVIKMKKNCKEKNTGKVREIGRKMNRQVLQGMFDLKEK
jgi:hypothetical protein